MAGPVWDTTALALRARERADMVGSTFVSDAEVLRYLENGWQELYGVIVIDNPKSLRLERTHTVNEGVATVGIGVDGTAKFEVKRIHAVLLLEGGVEMELLRPAALREILSTYRTGARGRPMAYELNGIISASLPDKTFQQLRIGPIPDKAYQVKLFYSPMLKLTDLIPLEEGESASGIPHNDWAQYVVLCAAIAMRDKEESDTSVLLAEKAHLLENMRSSWNPDDVSEADRVVQVSAGLRHPLVRTSRDPDLEGDFLG